MDGIYEENCDVSAIFFDLDNTLIQTRKGDTKACNQLVEVMHHQYGMPRDVAVDSAANFLRAFRARPEDESYELNKWEDYLLGLITNGPSRAQWQKIQRLELRPYFDCVLVSGDLPWEKPDQNIFLEACKLLNVEARTCIMVGDKLETDIKGGKEAELGGTVWIPLHKDAMESDLPDFTIHKVTELPEVLPSSPKFKRAAHPSC